MGVYINGEEFSEELLNEQDQILNEFMILDALKNFMSSKLPADISYFDTRKLDEMFKEIEKNDGQSEDFAYALSSIIINIGNAARQPSSLEKCYKANVRYKGQVLSYFNKYKGKLSAVGKAKLRHSIEAQFKHFEINPIKMALNGIKIKGIPLSRVPMVKLKLNPKSLGGSTLNSLVDMYIGWLAVKYYDLLEAVRVYKKATQSEYDINDPKSVYINVALKNEAEYFYDIAFRVLDDMLKVYDQL